MDDLWVNLDTQEHFSKFFIKGGDDDEEGVANYVGRCKHKGDLLPARVMPNRKWAFITWNGVENVKPDYELLIGPGYQWLPSENFTIPENAVSSGTTKDGESLYIGRGLHKGKVIMGKIQPSHQCLYISFVREEIKLTSYEILVRLPPDTWLPANQEHFPSNALVGGNDRDNTVSYAASGMKNGSDDDTISYVARVMHKGLMVPAKFLPKKGLAFIASDGVETPKTGAEVLVGSNYTWLKTYEKEVPPNAVFTGRTRDGQPLCVGRAFLRGTIIPGLVSLEGSYVWVPYRGRGLDIINYEILVKNN